MFLPVKAANHCGTGSSAVIAECVPADAYAIRFTAAAVGVGVLAPVHEYYEMKASAVELVDLLEAVPEIGEIWPDRDD